MVGVLYRRYCGPCWVVGGWMFDGWLLRELG